MSNPKNDIKPFFKKNRGDFPDPLDKMLVYPVAMDVYLNFFN